MKVICKFFVNKGEIVEKEVEIDVPEFFRGYHVKYDITAKCTKLCVIYFIRELGTFNYKIGKTKDLQKRLSTIRSSCANGIVLISECYTKETYEKKLHKRYEEYSLDGEWFEFGKKSHCIEEIKEDMLSVNIKKYNPTFKHLTKICCKTETKIRRGKGHRCNSNELRNLLEKCDVNHEDVDDENLLEVCEDIIRKKEQYMKEIEERIIYGKRYELLAYAQWNNIEEYNSSMKKEELLKLCQKYLKTDVLLLLDG